MEISVRLPVDGDGFLRRECPHCMRQFKWHDGPANEEAEQHSEPPSYFCPLCGQPAGTDDWFTQEQLDYIEGLAMPAAMREAEQELKNAFKGVRGKHLKIDFKGGADTPDVPDPLTEPDDMVMVTSPCHAYEPVKVPEEIPSPFHCLICGQAFAV